MVIKLSINYWQENTPKLLCFQASLQMEDRRKEMKKSFPQIRERMGMLYRTEKKDRLNSNKRMELI